MSMSFYKALVANKNSATVGFDVVFAVWTDCNDGPVCLPESCLWMLDSHTRSNMDIWEFVGVSIVIFSCRLEVVFPLHINFLKFVLPFRCKETSVGWECILDRVPI